MKIYFLVFCLSAKKRRHMKGGDIIIEIVSLWIVGKNKKHLNSSQYHNIFPTENYAYTIANKIVPYFKF
jgi:hypothetical protein